MTKDCVKPSVYAGVPCEKISSIDDYYKKRKGLQLDEAEDIFDMYYQKYGNISEIFFLFENAPIEELNEEHVRVLKLADSYQKSVERYEKRESRFSDYSEFVEYCLKEWTNSWCFMIFICAGGERYDASNCIFVFYPIPSN